MKMSESIQHTVQNHTRWITFERRELTLSIATGMKDRKAHILDRNLEENRSWDYKKTDDCWGST
jgi:hypothetical protein